MRHAKSVAAVAVVALVVGAWGAAQASLPDPFGRLVCHTFPVELPPEAPWDTAAADQPIGAWVTEMAERGWTLHSTQLAVGQKPTGFPQGYQQICMRPR